MSTGRETLHESVTACRFVAQQPTDDLPDTPAVASIGGSLVRLKPNRRWSPEVHFNEDLCVSLGSAMSNNATAAVCCQWQGMAHESLSVAISPEPRYHPQHMWQVCFGDEGNTCTTIQKGQGRRRHSVKVPSLVCQAQSWVSYWVCWVAGSSAEEDTTASNSGSGSTSTLYVGVGDEPGKQCVAILQVPYINDNDSKKNTSQQAGDTTEEPEKQMDKEEHTPTDDNDETKTVPKVPEKLFIGFGNRAVADRQAPVALQIRNIAFKSLDDPILVTFLQSLDPASLELVHVGTLDAATQQRLETFQDECRKAQARAKKFGVPYQAPPPFRFLPWSEQRKLRANPQTGFRTGLDLSDPTEKSKQEARRKRFGGALPARDTNEDGNEAAAATTTMDSTGIMEEDIVPVYQAWDKEDLVTKLRTDPPKSLWNVPPSADNENDNDEMVVDEFRAAPVVPPTFTPHKIHIFSIDWAAFKQIRTNDIMSYFSVYGPSYVEWLGDLSCNVQFEDQFSAARALENMSTELPTPVPDDLAPRTTTATPSTTSDTDKGNPVEESSPPSHADLGAMGWRIGKKMLRKVKSDRYGQRGSSARLLMRIATSLDILEERPSSWLKPPPGFTTKRVLGPESDFFQKRKRENKRQRRETPVEFDANELMNTSLSAGRGGFSVEELEAERAQKRAKKQDSQE